MEADPSILLIKKDDRFFRVSAAGWDMIVGLSSGKSDDAIVHDIGKHFASNMLDVRHLAIIKTHLLSQLATHSVSRKTVHLWGTLDIVKHDKLGVFVENLPIFPRDLRLFYPLLAAAAAINMAFVELVPNLFGRVFHSHSTRDTIVVSVFALISMFIIMFFHELGHAAAVSRFGLRPSRIGAGFFLIFPALFADVSEIWRLRSRKRIVVNLAGVFVQSWISVLLLIAWLVAPAAFAPALNAIYLVNLASIAANLIPFAKLDGYWVLADALDCPNLHADAIQAVARTFGQGKQCARRSLLVESALVAFGLGNIAFYGSVVFIAILAIFRFLHGLTESISPFLFITETFQDRPIGFLTSAFVIYRLSVLVIQAVRSKLF
jgi:Zn-dependent protease